MKIVVIFFLSLVFGITSLNANSFTKSATIEPVLVQKGNQKEWCPVCGMNIKTFYKTSHTSKLHNGKDRQYCSIRCLVVDMQEYKIDTKSVQVIDAATQKLIDASTAFYVVESEIRGTMSKVSKLAFANSETAEDFSIDFGGKVVNFTQALKIAQDSLEADVAMTANKKEKKVYPMGKKIFEKMCKQNIDLDAYLEINQLKSAVKNEGLCKPLKEEQLQALCIYLWEVKRVQMHSDLIKIIEVKKDEKCPICGMFVYKYPKWAAQIFYKETHYSFDGVKDMMKYYFQEKNKNAISKIIVTDYYSQEAVNAQEAYYVTGSDVYGPMGDELIPFKRESEAKTFSMDHKGFKVLNFKDITKEEVNKLDE
jgi:nitrous oxide reductase accessory protein NosL